MNSISNVTSGLLKMSETKLFILFLVTGISFHSSSSPGTEVFIGLLNLVGGLFFLGWLHAIGHRAKEKLDKKNIQSTLLKFFDLYFLLVIGCAIALLIISNGSQTLESRDANFHLYVTYTNPPILSAIFFGALVLIVITTAKSLVSAEQLKDVEFGDYFKTLLLLVFPFIGIWFIQPRAQKI